MVLAFPRELPVKVSVSPSNWRRFSQLALSAGIIFGLSLPLYAAETSTPPELSLATLNLNQQLALDLEILPWTADTFSLPIKYVAGQLDIATQQNSQGVITFKHPKSGETVTIDPNTQIITIGNTETKTFEHPLVRNTNGIFSADDIYLDKSLVETLLDIKMDFDANSQQVNVTIDRPVQALLKIGGLTSDEDDDGTGQPLTGVIQEPGDSGKLFETLTLDLNTNQYKEIQTSPTELGLQRSRFVNTGALWETGLRGYIRDMPYEFTPRWSWRNGTMNVADVQWLATKDMGKTRLDIGSLNTGLSPLVMPFANFWGAQWGTQNALGPVINPTSSRSFTGKSPRAGRVRVEVNGVTLRTQRVQPEGDYRFENVPLTPESINTVRIILKDSDGQETVLHQDNVAYFSQTLAKDDLAYSVFLGRTPIQFQPPGFGIKQILLDQSNKWVMGGRAYYGLTNRLTLGLAAAGDTIFGERRTSAFSSGLNIQQIPDLTGYASYGRDPNFWSGANMALSANYRIKDNWSLLSDVSTSFRQQYELGLRSKNGPIAFGGQFATRYQLPRFSAQARLFHFDTDFYSPITLGTGSQYDRRGGALESGGSWKNFNYSGSWEHYNTNLSGILNGGEIAVNRYTASLFRPINALTDLRVRGLWSIGDSEGRDLDTVDQQVEMNRLLPWGIHWYLSAKRTNTTLTDFSIINALPNSNLIKIFQSDFQIPLPRDIGYIRLGTSLTNQLDLFNMQASLRFGKYIIEPLLQKNIGGDQAFTVAGCGFYRERANGQRIGFRYLYNMNSLASLSGILGSGERTSHQIQVDFFDTLAMMGSRLLSLGRNYDSTGTVHGTAFLDLNRDGVQDSNEPGIKDIPVLMNNETAYTTDKKGRFFRTGLYPGNFSFAFDFPNLPINLTPTTANINAVIKPGRVTKVKMGLIMTPGSIKGQVLLKDASGNALDPTDVIVALKDSEGKEVQFTYADAKGRYLLSDLPPGTYTLVLDAKQIDSKHLQLLKAPDPIVIPIDYENFIEKDNMNLEVLQLMRAG